MKNLDRLARITNRARLVYRVRHAVEGALVVGIVAAAFAFTALLAVGLGFVASSIWQSVAVGCSIGVALGALAGALRPLSDQHVLQRVDRDHKLGNALSTAREFLLGADGAPRDVLMAAHIHQSLERAEGMMFARAVTLNLGTRARILGILCVCIISVALI
ncbi:MAG: hypothetical protein ABI333_17610 [bacterium]